MKAAEQILLTGGKVVLPDREASNAFVFIVDGKVQTVGEMSGKSPADFPNAALHIDTTDHFILPGLIDQHIHGAGGASVIEDTEVSLRAIAEVLTRHGVTSWCPTTMAMPDIQLMSILSAVDASVSDWPRDLAKPVGIHLEGPFINPTARGAHNLSGIIPPSIEATERYVQASGNRVKIITFAPELPGGIDVTRRMTALGVVPSIGHTCASAPQVQSAVAAGAKCATHLFNRMPQFHHRDPGAVGRLLLDDQVMLEIVADGHLVHPAMVELAVRTATSRRIILVSDAMPPAGSTDKRGFVLAGRRVEVRDGACFLTTGEIWGSITTLDGCLANVAQWMELPLPRLAEMASLNPARLLGISNTKGSIERGKDADVTILDSQYRVKACLIGGRPAFVDPAMPARWLPEAL